MRPLSARDRASTMAAWLHPLPPPLAADDGRRLRHRPGDRRRLVPLGRRRRRVRRRRRRRHAARRRVDRRHAAGGADRAAPRTRRRCRRAAFRCCRPTACAPDLLEAPLGRVDARAGAAAARCIERAVALVAAGEAAAIVTAPIHKEAFAAAGIALSGPHRDAAGARRRDGGALPPVRMMLANDELRTVLVTIHMSLRAAIDAITFEAVLETIRIADAARAPARRRPRRASPSPGSTRTPARAACSATRSCASSRRRSQAARAEGIDASGPFAPDTVFMRARNAAGHPGEFDVVVAMTHDHGLIPVKYLGVERRRQRDARPAVRAHQPGPRHRVRHRRHRHGRPVELRARAVRMARAARCGRRRRRAAVSAASALRARRAACAPAASRAP